MDQARASQRSSAIFIPPANGESAAAKRRGRPPLADGDVSEELILTVAFDMFCERGYERTTLRYLAERLVVSHGFFNARFGGKQDLWRRAVLYHLAAAQIEIDALFERQFASETARLVSIVTSVTRLAGRKPGLLRLINGESRIDSARLDFLHDHVIGPFAAKLDDVLAAVGREHDRAPPDVVTFSIYLTAMVTCFFAEAPLIRRLGGVPPVTPEEVARQARITVDMLLGPFRAPEEPPANPRLADHA